MSAVIALHQQAGNRAVVELLLQRQGAGTGERGAQPSQLLGQRQWADRATAERILAELPLASPLERDAFVRTLQRGVGAREPSIAVTINRFSGTVLAADAAGIIAEARSPTGHGPWASPGGVAADPHAADSPPPRYSALPRDLLLLLARSVGNLREFGTNPAATLWEYLDRLEAAHLATLVQVSNAARHVGFWPHVRTLRHVYVGSSWGFEFDGNSGAIQSIVEGTTVWCCDLQPFVRPEHGNTAHEWWRNCEQPAGRRGLHVGLDWGAGYLNLHYDSQNPAEGRQTQSAWSYVNPFVIGQMLANRYVCNYDFEMVRSHNVDIHSSGGRNFPAPFAEIHRMRYLSDRTLRLYQHEINDALGEHTESRRNHEAAQSLRHDLDDFDRESRVLATQPAGETDASALGFTQRAARLQERLLQQFRAAALYTADRAASLGIERSRGVNQRGIERAVVVAEWRNFTTHHADDLMGSYYSLAEQRRRPHSARGVRPPP